jgi:hypothetical protein
LAARRAVADRHSAGAVLASLSGPPFSFDAVLPLWARVPMHARLFRCRSGNAVHLMNDKSPAVKAGLPSRRTLCDF